jgi:hypothetical protein
MVCKTDIYWSQKPKTQYRNLLLPLSARRGVGRRFRQLHHWGRLKPICRHTARTTDKACGPADAKAGMLPAHSKTV